MGYYEDEAGKRVSLVSGLSPWEEEDNPYWILNRTKLHRQDYSLIHWKHKHQGRPCVMVVGKLPYGH